VLFSIIYTFLTYCCREFALVTSLLQIKFSEDPTADEAVGGRRGRRERRQREKGIRGVVLGWGSHVNSFAKLAQVTDAQNKACVKRSRVYFAEPQKLFTSGVGSEKHSAKQ
jgi:hypothetical protein